ncbi:MAG TPA: hypothetical protein GX401_09415 [Clostridiales bacterium]|nr:hypothetical protein [Clostridiales bacterium]
MQVKKRHKIRNAILLSIAGVLLVVVTVGGILWNRYLNKNSLITAYSSLQGREIYILGTLHDTHFNKLAGYSMEDILSAVKNINPDVVMLEARADIFEEYGAVDGPVDMSVVYAYCLDNSIPVELIDWWVVDNTYEENKTNGRRDDEIHNNIILKSAAYSDDSRILFVCGSGHFYEQAKRLEADGYSKMRLTARADYFKNPDKDFRYPASVCDVWEKRAYFYAYTYPEIVDADETLSEDIKKKFTGGNHDGFYRQLMKYCKLFESDELYQ